MDEFSLITTRSGNIAVLEVSGRVDSVNAIDLDTELSKVAQETNKIVLDLKGVPYISSAGLRTIIKALRTAQRSGGSVKLASVTEQVSKILEVTGMMDKPQSFPTADEAVASF